MSLNIVKLSNDIKEKAIFFGFTACGFAKATELTADARYLEQWLNQQQHADMQYMANHFEKRIDPRKLVDGAKTVISLSYNYYQPNQKPHHQTKIAMYALGKDYHKIVKDKLFLLLNYIKTQVGDVNARCFVDSAPVLERAWAVRSGIGWVGKNTNLLTKRQGSYYFLAEIILDVELDFDSPVKDYCGSCTKCIDACPTAAIEAPYQLNAAKCISYHTIESKEAAIPSNYHGKFDNWLYGCDICQQVCPINSQAKQNNEAAFTPIDFLLTATKADWEKMNEETFAKIFRDSSIKRTGLVNIKRNLSFLDS